MSNAALGMTMLCLIVVVIMMRQNQGIKALYACCANAGNHLHLCDACCACVK